MDILSRLMVPNMSWFLCAVKLPNKLCFCAPLSFFEVFLKIGLLTIVTAVAIIAFLIA